MGRYKIHVDILTGEKSRQFRLLIWALWKGGDGWMGGIVILATYEFYFFRGHWYKIQVIIYPLHKQGQLCTRLIISIEANHKKRVTA